MPYFFRFSLSSGPVLPVVLTLVALTHTFPHLSLATWRHGDMETWTGDLTFALARPEPDNNTGLIFTPRTKIRLLKNLCRQISIIIFFTPFFKDFLNRFYQQGINYSRFYLFLSAQDGMCEGQTA